MIRIERIPDEPQIVSAPAGAAFSGSQGAKLLAVPRRLEDIQRPPEILDPRERSALARRLEEQLAPLSPHVAVLDAARSLAEPRACAVVTGQQPGFLASPLYSLYKALHALRLARLLRERWSVPVVAIFWNHADDHDVAEVHHAHLVNRNLDLQKVSLPGLSSGRQPLSRIVLDESTHHLAAIRALLQQLLEGAPFAARAIDIFAPRSGETLPRAFTRSLTELLGWAGLVVLEPDWIRLEMSRHLARIAASDFFPHLERGGARLRELGLEPPIDPSGAALFYLHQQDGRRALRAGGEGFRFDGESGSRTGAELAAEIVHAPLDWSPGALLRPIVQDLCLPVAAYVGGAGELAYHAELPDLRTHLGAPKTPFVPRFSCTLVDPECRASLARLRVDLASVLRARGTFAADETGVDAPPAVTKMREIAERSAREMEALQGDVAALDPSLVSQLKRSAGQVRSAGEWFSEKAERVHQNKSGKSRRHVRRLNHGLCPLGEPQERVLGPLPFVARFGEEWLPQLLDALDPFDRRPLAVHLGEDAQGGGA